MERKLVLVEQSYNCNFCYEMTFGAGDLEGVLCRHCGLDIDQSDEASPRMAPAGHVGYKTRQQQLDDAFSSFLLEVTKQRRHRRLGVATAVGGAMVATVTGALFVNPFHATPGHSDTHAQEAVDAGDNHVPVTELTHMSVAQFNARDMATLRDVVDATPLWLAQGEATQVGVTTDGRHVLIQSGHVAAVYDAHTGAVVATRQVDGEATFFVAGDTVLVRDATGVNIWNSDASSGDTERDASSGDATSDSDIGWRHVAVDDDAKLRQFGHVAVLEQDGNLSLITSDASLETLVAPEGEATLIGVDDASTLWATGDKVRIVARSDATQTGIARREIRLHGDATSDTLVEVVAANNDIMFSVWATADDTFKLVVHDAATGHPQGVYEDTAAAVDALSLTPDERYLYFGNVTIDARTGAKTGVVLRGSVEHSFPTGWVVKRETSEARFILYAKTGEYEVMTDLGEGNSVVAATDDLFLVNTGDGVLALRIP